MAILSLINLPLAYVKQHWLECVLLFVLWLAWRWRKADIANAWARWEQPAWLSRVLRRPRASRSIRFCAHLLGVLFIYLLFSHQAYSYKKTGVPSEVELSPRLQRLFEHTKLVCFGRYAMTVPQEAEVLWGAAGFPKEIKIIQGGISAMKKFITEDITEIQKDNTSEIIASEKEPVLNSWQIRWYENEYLKESELLNIRTYVNKGDLSFVYSYNAFSGAKGSPQSRLQPVLAKHLAFSQSIQLREVNENPATPGFCIDHGFIKNDQYSAQETIQAGIYLPSFPDVTFSIYSNKNASVEGANGNGLLKSIAEAKIEQGIFYPRLNILREGQRHVSHWHGEESLMLRPNGVHEFNWEFVGKTGDVAKPPWFTVTLFTKVAHNLVGAAEKTALSDDETVALWDKLLDSLRFRIPVPGVPDSSAYLPPALTN